MYRTVVLFSQSYSSSFTYISIVANFLQPSSPGWTFLQSHLGEESFLALLYIRALENSRSAASSRLDGLHSLPGSFVTLLCRPPVVHISTDCVLTASDAGFFEVSNGVFCFCVAYYVLVWIGRGKNNVNLLISAALTAHANASFSFFAKIGSAPKRYHAQSAIIASGSPASAAPV